MPGTLSHNKLYKIRTLVSGKVITWTEGSDAKVCTDLNDDGQKWHALNTTGDSWRLKNKKQQDGSDVYLEFYEPTRKSVVQTGDKNRTWSITQWNSPGGAVYRAWANGAAYECVLDLKNASPGDSAEMWLYEPNGSVAQFWLFEEVPE